MSSNHQKIDIMNFMESLVPLFAIIGTFLSVIIFIYMRYKTKHQQRMALIESGQSADIFTEKKLDQRDSSLKLGLLLTGAGLGFLLGVLLSEIINIEEVIIFPCTLIGGGIGLVIFYMITRKKDAGYSDYRPD